ncbi:MAG: metal-dependent hydrolase [Candidatus Bathyarchaeia archaeon]
MGTLVGIRWLGHSAFELAYRGARVYVDPFISNNPRAPIGVEEIRGADFILITHDHADHLGDAEAIARRTGATIVAIPEVAGALGGDLKKVQMNMGSMVDLGKGIRTAMVPAAHTANRGGPVGYVIEGDGISIYHAGDTALFGDMALIKRLYSPDVALLPIGGHYVMGPKEAAVALTLLEPKVAIPMHYGTFPVLYGEASAFAEEAKKLAPSVKVVVLRPGESTEYP